jgi:hypothetical protein
MENCKASRRVCYASGEMNILSFLGIVWIVQTVIEAAFVIYMISTAPLHNDWP